MSKENNILLGVKEAMRKRPNIVYVFSDQHRFDAAGYMGNLDVMTPVMDRMAKNSISFQIAVANAPVCGPARASLLTGQRSLTNGVFLNDVCLNPQSLTIGKILKGTGYETAYIGKWHLDGHGRQTFIPKERRQGFDMWRVLECTHNYNNSYYYGDEPIKLKWEGYDVEAQTSCALNYIQNRKQDKPFGLFLSWGPPHSPYHTAPQRFRDMYDPDSLTLRPNVTSEWAEKTRSLLSGYYAHVSALDEQLGRIWSLLQEEGIEDETIFIYTSDHGDMIGSHGHENKQWPWDESIRVPFLLHYPAAFGNESRRVDIPFSTIDIMPTLLDLCGISVPDTVEGKSFKPYLLGEEGAPVEAALIECVHPFGQFIRSDGGKEYRGIRTGRYTYVRDRNGPWLLYDNYEDPYQLINLIDTTKGRELITDQEEKLLRLLKGYGDEFLHGDEYVKRWDYKVDTNGTVPYTGYDPAGE